MKTDERNHLWETTVLVLSVQCQWRAFGKKVARYDGYITSKSLVKEDGN